MTEELPKGWTSSTIEGLFRSFSGGTPNKGVPSYWNGTIPWLSSGDIKSDRINSSTFAISTAGLHASSAKLCRAGSVVVVVRSGILKHTLPVAVLDREAAINQDLKCFDSGNDDLNCWLALALKAHAGEILALNREGTTVQSVKYETLKNFDLRLPPPAEQSRIVRKLDVLLGKAGQCRERLTVVSAILERFRRSVLSAACSGSLTADWRKDNPELGIDSILSAIKRTQLLAAKTTAQKARYRETFSTREGGASEDLPSSWRFVRLSKLVTSFDYGTSAKSHRSGKIPVLRMGNLQGGEVDWSDLAYTSNASEIKKYSLSPGTVLFNRTNSPELVGKSAIYRGERSAIFAGYLIRINPHAELSPEYLNFCLNTSYAREFCASVKTDGVSQSNINAQKLGTFELPFCHPTEQREIVRRVEGLFSLADKIEARFKAVQQQVHRLPQSILTKAFSGELVSTEAELAEREGRRYESAEELLTSIRNSSEHIQGSHSSDQRTSLNNSIIDGISLDGFSEPITIDELRQTRCRKVPEKSGIYMIIRPSDRAPNFLRKSTGGWFKGLDPSYPLKVVHENWVDGAHVMYVGMTAAEGGLRSRLCQFFDFGASKRVAHRGGRLLWHLEDSAELLVCWRTCAASKADAAETAAIASFKSVHDGRRPFANILK